jgi:hypothetical protein
MERTSRSGAGALLLRHWQAVFALLYALCGWLPFVWLYTDNYAVGQYSVFALPAAMTLQVLAYPVFMLLLWLLEKVSAGLRSVSGAMSAAISTVNLGFLFVLLFTIRNTADRGDWPGQPGSVLDLSLRAGYYVLFALTLFALVCVLTGWRMRRQTARKRTETGALV